MGDRYRAGRSVGRTIYAVQPDGSEQLVGVMDTRELAAEVVEAMNGRALRGPDGPRRITWACCGSTEPFHPLPCPSRRRSG